MISMVMVIMAIMVMLMVTMVVMMMAEVMACAGPGDVWKCVRCYEDTMSG